MKSKRKACTERPTPIQGIDAPEDTDSQVSFMGIRKVIDQALLAVQTHLEGSTSSGANESPGQQLFIAVEIVDALRERG